MESTPVAGKRVAFFGGSFDPPHKGHLAVARAARQALELDTVLFAPVGAQPLKPEGSTAGFEDRVAMTRLAIAGKPGFAVSLADAPKPSAAPNYTFETLLDLRTQLPPEGVLFCLMGADSFFGLRRWHRAAEIPFIAPLIVASRPGQPLDDLRQALPPGLTMDAAFPEGDSAHDFSGSTIGLLRYILRNPAEETTPLYLLPGLNIDISASQVREQIQSAAEASDSGASDSGSELLCTSVLNYIRAHRLYR